MMSRFSLGLLLLAGLGPAAVVAGPPLQPRQSLVGSQLGDVCYTRIMTRLVAVVANTTSPGAYVTRFEQYTGSGLLSTPTTVATVLPSSGVFGTFVVQTPARYVTQFTLYTGTSPISDPVTLSAIPPSSRFPGTYIVASPGPSAPVTYTTVFVPYTGVGVISTPSTVATIPPFKGNPGKYVVAIPVSYTTVFRQYT